MVIANEKFTITVTRCEFEPEKTNGRTVFLVEYYGPHTNIVFVDKDAPQKYLEYAVAHEMVLREGNTEFCGVPLPDKKDPTRRREIDRILLDWVIPASEREQYVRGHVEMLEYLRDLGKEKVAVDYCLFYLQTWLRAHTGKKDSRSS